MPMLTDRALGLCIEYALDRRCNDYIAFPHQSYANKAIALQHLLLQGISVGMLCCSTTPLGDVTLSNSEAVLNLAPPTLSHTETCPALHSEPQCAVMRFRRLAQL